MYYIYTNIYYYVFLTLCDFVMTVDCFPDCHLANILAMSCNVQATLEKN